MWVVDHVIKDYRHLMQYSDLKSAGLYGLIQGIEKYREGKGTKPSTYARHWVKAEVLKSLYENRNVHIPWNRINAYIKEKQSFVVVSNEEPLTVIEKINNVIKIPKNITIVARKGFAWQKELLDRINLLKAKQVIILKPDVGENHNTELDCDVEVGKSFTFLVTNENWQKKQ